MNFTEKERKEKQSLSRIFQEKIKQIMLPLEGDYFSNHYLFGYFLLYSHKYLKIKGHQTKKQRNKDTVFEEGNYLNWVGNS